MSTLLDVLGALLIVVGIGLVYIPAAFIVAGVLLLAASFNLAKVEPKGDES